MEHHDSSAWESHGGASESWARGDSAPGTHTLRAWHFSFFKETSFVLSWKLYGETFQNEIWDSAEKWDSKIEKYSITGEKQRTNTNSTVANDTTGPKLPENYDAAQHVQLEHRTSAAWTEANWKLQSKKRNISTLKRAGTGHFQQCCALEMTSSADTERL